MRVAVLALFFAGVAGSAVALAEPPIHIHIDSISPAFGSPSGGQFVTISGANFRTPARVFFDLEDGSVPKESFLVSTTSRQIQVITPPVDLGIGQMKTARLILLASAGGPDESRTVSTQVFTYVNEVLHPLVRAVSPFSGPLTGGTRVTMFGEGFQAPIQVFFDDVEAQVIGVSFGQLTVISPARKSIGTASVRITNINSNTTTTLPDAYRYVVPMTFNSVSPSEGSSFGGTQLTITGSGFRDPVYVSVAGVPAQVLKVSDSAVVVRTGSHANDTCADSAGQIAITNIDNGDVVTGGTFKYVTPRPVFTSIPPMTAGESVTVTVTNARALTARFKLGDRVLTPRPIGDTMYVLDVPANFVPLTGDCAAPVKTTLLFVDFTTGCQISQTVVVRPAKTAHQCEPRVGRRGGN